MATDTAWFNPRGGGYFHMNDRGRFIQKQYNPNNVHIGEGYGGGPLSIGNPRNDTNQLAYNNDLPWMTVGEIDRDGGTEAWKRYSAGDPRYKWDPKRTPKVIQPRLDNTGAYSSTQLASAPHGYSTDNFYNPNDDQYYNDYEDDYHDNPMRDDYFVQDPFSDIWGGQGGPLKFG